MDRLPAQVRALLADADFPWAFCGGYALALFAGKAIRPHGDIDVSLPESARAATIAYLLGRGWRIHEYRGMGKVKPIHAPADSEPGRNLMASLADCPLVQFFPCEEEGLLYHQFTPGMTTLSFIDLLFSPETPPVCRAQDGSPILAPEVSLLYKAARPGEASAQADFAAVYSLLDDGQRARFQAALAAKYPEGHPWRTEQE